jgi:hypothetical protein
VPEPSPPSLFAKQPALQPEDVEDVQQIPNVKLVARTAWLKANVPVLTVQPQDPIVWRTENARAVVPMPTVDLWMEVKLLAKPLVWPEFVSIHLTV